MKKSVVKLFRNFLFLCSSILSGLAFYSCGEDAGLGGAIDTKAPTLSIDYPKESGSAIRDSFILAGTVSDDKSISRVAVNVKSLDDGGKFSKTYSASFDPVKNRWWVDINRYDSTISDYHNGWQYPDGNYEFSVTAFDNAGNNSGTYSKTFEIDNTPPVFIISNPGVIKKTDLSPSAYGSLFTIDGTISDNHTISFMDVIIYNASGECVSSETYEGKSLPFYREEDIATAGGTSVQIAQYANASVENRSALNTRYTQLHESDSGTEYYYAEIKLTDSTKVYQDPWGDGSRSAEELSADQLGNSTSKVYLYDDVYASLMSAKKGLGLSAANLKDIISGVYTGSADKDEVLKVLYDKAYDTSLVEDDPMANKLSFSLNPEANPTYNVNGFEFGFNADDVVQSASTGNTVSVTISAGLDGTNIAPEIVRVWMKEYKDRPTDADSIKADLRALEKQVETLEKSETEFLDALHKSETAAATTVKTGDSDWVLIYDYSLNNSKGSSVSTKTFSVTLPEGIKLSKYYILGVTGYDIEDVEFAQNSVYGFEGNTAGVPPTLKIETPANLSIWGDFEKPQFSGTATISSKSLYLTELTATLTIQDETTNATEGEFTDTITCKIENDKPTWELSEVGALTWDSENEKWNLDTTKLPGLVELYNTKAKTADGVYWLATLKISGKSSSGHEGESSQSIHIDTVAPKVSLASVTPSVSGSDYFGGTDTNTYLNGTVTVKGNIDEQNMADSDDAVSYDILAATGDDEPVSILAELIAHADDLGVAFDGKLGKAVTINQSFNTRLISEFFHAFKGAAEDEKIKIEVKVTVKDKAGNLGTCSSNILNDGKYFIIYQETDRPKIELGNADSAIVKADDVKINHNLFGTTSNNKLTISFSDDDSIAEYEVSVYNDKGELLPSANVSAQGENTPNANPYTFKPKKTTASLSYILPSEEAKYQIEIKAHDEFYLPATSLSSPNPYGEKIVEKFFVAVDSGAPEVEISKPAVGSFQSGSVQIEGSVSKAVDLEGTLTKTGSTKPEDTKKFSLKSTQMTKDGKSYNWTLPADVAEDGEYSIDVKVTDIYGQTAGKSRTFKVDTKSPEIKSATTSVDSANGLVPLDEMEYITLRTDVTDGAESKSVAGVSVVKYYLTKEKFTDEQLKTENVSQIKTAFDGTNWTQMNQGSTNEENVTSFNASVPVKTFATEENGLYEGKAYLYVATEDNVGNFAIKAEPVELNLDKSAPVIVVSDFSTKDPSAKFKVVIEDSNPDSLTSSDPEFVTVGDCTISEGTGTDGANEKKYENISLNWNKYKDDPDSAELEVEKTVTFTATDTNGRTTTRKVTLECDNRAPKVTRAPGDLFSKSNALEITGTITDKNYSGDATVYLVPVDSSFDTKDVSIPFSASADASNGYNYTANITGLDDTTYNIAIVAKDSFGNKSYWSTDASKTTAVTGSDTSNVGNIGNPISIDSTAPLATVKLSVSNENNDAKVLGNAKTGIDADSTDTASKVYSSDKIKFDSKYYTNRTFTISGVITEANLVCTDADIASAGSITKVPTLTIVKESSKGRESVAVGAGEFVVNYAGKVGNDIPWSFTKTYKEDGSDDGIYEFTLEVWDMSKQQFKKTVTVVLDTTAPEVAITSPVDGESFETQPTAKIAYSDDGVGINTTSEPVSIVYEVHDVTNNSPVDISSFTKFNASATGSLTFADSFSSEGTFKIRAIVTDYLGHTKESDWNTFYFDKSKPKVDEGGVGASGLTTNGVKENESVKKFTLSGTVSDTNALYNDGEADSNGKTAITISTTVKKTEGGVLKDVEEEWKIPLTLTNGKKAASWEKEFVIGSENYTATNYLPDGTYNFTIVATDVANKTNQISRTVKVDTKAPTFGTADVITDATTAQGGTKWYRTSDLRIKGTATDNDGTGISVVYFQTSVDDGENWSSKTELAGTTDWSGTVEKLVSKKTKVRVIAEDNAHNTSDPVVLGPFNIDTAEPTLVADSVKVVKTDATEEAVSSLYVNGKSALVIKFKASDGEAGDNSSGVKKVYISPYAKIQTETGLDDYTSSTNEFSVTVEKDKLSTGTIYARIYDNAGNYSDVNLLSTTLDNEAPKIPSVTLEDKNTAFKAYTATEDENGNQIYYVHGSDSHTFKLSGIATDNFGITSVEYKLGDADSVKKNQTEFSWNFDNLTLTSDVNLTITVTDNAENTSAKTLVIKQDSQGPVVAATEFPSGYAASNVVLKGTVSDENLSSAADAFKVWLVPVPTESQSATATTTAKEGVISLTTTDSGANWEASFSSLNDGVKYNIAIVAKDALGNISKYSSDAGKTTAQTGTDTSTTAVATLGSAFTIDIDAPKLAESIKIGTAENPTSEIPADGFFVKNDVPIYIKGKLTDNSASGVKSAYYKLYDSITVNEVNKTADATQINIENDGNFTIKTLITKSGAINAVFFDNVGNYEKVTLVNFTYDPESPKIQSSNITDKTEHFTAYENGKDSSGNRIFYLNNDSSHKFTISGVATDNLGLAKVQLDLAGAKIVTTNSSGVSTVQNSFEITNADKLASWTFDNLDLSGVASGALATITLTDKAGNTASTSLKITLDTVGPEGKHDTATDKDGQDLYFRMGENVNLLSELKKWTPSISELTDAVDKDVGGKYSATTYGNSETIRFRGKFDDNAGGKFDDNAGGSGVEMIYYLLTTTEPTTGTDGNNIVENFRKNYASQATGYFSLFENGKVEKRRVAYKDASGNRKFAEDVESNFKTMISGFTSAKQYLILVAVDKVGNAKVDGTYYTINVDSDLPEIDTVVTENIITNGKVNEGSVDKTAVVIGYSGNNADTYANYTIRGTVDDASAGIRSLSIDANGNIIDKEHTDYGTIKIWDAPETDKPNKKNWAITLKKKLFVEANTANKKSISISLNAIDDAGSGNSQKAPVATIVLDTTPPEVTLTAPSDAYTVTSIREINGIISLSGTAKDGNTLPENGEGDISNTIQRIEYSTDKSNWHALTVTSIKGDYTFTAEGFDTTQLTDEQTYYLRAVAQDVAGNIGYSDTVKDGEAAGSKDVVVKVAQNTDRPVIKITSLANSSSWLTSKALRGSISDDDGLTGLTFAISENGTDATPTWTPVPVTNGSWTYTFSGAAGENDGQKSLYFKVVDAKTTEFVSASTNKFKNTEKHKRPYYLYDTTASSDYDLTASTECGLPADAAIVINLDTAAPRVFTLGMDISTTATSLKEASVVKEATGSYTINEATKAGGNSKYIKFYVPVFDANLKDVKISITDALSGTVETKYSTATGTNQFTSGILELTRATVIPDGETDSVPVTIEASGVTYTYYESTPIAIASDAVTNLKTLKVTVSDNAGNETPASANFYIDNTGPETIVITSPSTTDEVTGTINIVGTASDVGSAGISSIEWLVPPKTYTEETTDAALAALEGWTSDNNTKGSASVWNFKFLAGSATDLTVYDDTTKYKVEHNATTNIYKIPLFFKTTDVLGNVYIKRDFYVTHNPDADRPVTEFNYPTISDYDSGKKYVTLAGTIRVSGTVEIPSGTTDVGQVYIQIGTVATDGTITWTKDNAALANEFATLATIVENGGVKTKEDLDKTYTKVQYVLDDWWGIPVNTKTATWNISLNSDGKLDPEANSTSNIALRACAINADGKMGLWTDAKTTDPIYIHVDANAPGQTAVMRQYSTFSSSAMESKVSLQKDYSPEMYLKGKWYAVVTIKDNDSLDVATLKVKRGSVNLTKDAASNGYYLSSKTWEYTEGAVTTGDSAESGRTVKSVSQKVYIPVDTEAIGSTSVNYSVYIEDTSHFASTMTYNFFIDNKAPEFSTLTGNSDDLLAASPAGIENSNYVYNLGGKLKEEGSGFSRIFFYFLRNNVSDSSAARLLDSQLDYAATGNDGRNKEDRQTNVSDYFESFTSVLDSYTVTQGSSTFTMYGKTYLGSLDTDGKAFTSTAGSLEANKHIRAGGLIFIGGDYHKITSVRGTKVEFEDEVSTAVTEAGFPYGQVVDHTEKSDMNDETHVYNITGDDGDGMPESAITVSGTTTWEGTIYSDRMTDGPVTLVCIAFDQAGNVAEKRIATKIKNNAPRLAKLYLGTDLSGDGKYAANEFNTYQFVSAEADGSYKDAHGNFKESVELATSGTNYSSYGKPFEIRSGLAVVPEITGGNGAIKLAYLKSASEKAAVTGSGASVFRGTDTSTKITATFSPITNATSGKVDTVHKFILEGNDFSDLTDGTGKGMSFTFWDSTDGTVCGSDSNNCYVYVTDFTLALNDSVVPKSVIDPFYWNGLKENSVYGSSSVTYASQLKGHIELESDWKETSAYANRGTDSELDGDPKVSGKITMTGYAYDNQRLSSLWIAFDNFTPAAYLSTGGDAAATANTVAAAGGTYENSGTNGDNKTYYQVAYFTPSTGNWTKTTASMAANGWEFVLTDEKADSEDTYLSQSGHKVKWTLSIDTEKCSPIVATDIKARVIAFDHKGNVVKVSGTVTVGDTVVNVIKKNSTNIDGSDNVPLYQMDVVPYIAGVKTELSTVKKGVKSSLYDRTALGHYPVDWADSVYLYGFNLTGGSLVDSEEGRATSIVLASSSETKFNTTTLTYSLYKATINKSATMRSGKVAVKVGDIVSLNNKNNNNSKGGYEKTVNLATSKTGDKEIFGNYYNRLPNGDNNNLLTDDVVLDVWEFDSDAAVPISGKIEQPIMKINPATGQLGFAFVNGPLYFSMGGKVGTNSYSYDYWTASFDFFTSVGFAYDSLGHTYAVAAGGDINSDSADKLMFMTDRWGEAFYGTGYDRRYSSYNGVNSLRLESIGMKGTKTNTTDTTNNFDKQRIKSPSFATSVHGEDTNVYLAYYDAMNDEVRFKAGAYSTYSNATKISNVRRIERLDNTGWKGIFIKQKDNDGTVLKIGEGSYFYLCDKDGNIIDNTRYSVSGYWDGKLADLGLLAFVAKNDSGQESVPAPGVTDAILNNATTDGQFKILNDDVFIKIESSYKGFGDFLDFDEAGSPYQYRHDAVSMIAGSNTDRNAGEYVSIGVVPGTTTTTDVVVAVWYDQTERVLKYAYNDSPLTNRNGQTSGAGWKGVKTVFSDDSENAGEYCQLTVDAKGGIHIAAYDPTNCNLVYAYLSTYGDTPKTCVVDSNGVVGSNITIDVAMNGTGANAKAVPQIGYYATSCIRPKCAYPVNGIDSTTQEGSVDDEFTGAWECTVVPTARTVNMQSNQYNKMNVAVWKTSAGVLTNCADSTTFSQTKTTSENTYTNTPNSYSSTSYGFAYGNGTDNAIMGYTIKVNSTSDAIETAQMR